MDKNNIRQFIRSVRNENEQESRRTLKDILKEKVLKRLKETTEN